jgi:hypothetical protein
VISQQLHPKAYTQKGPATGDEVEDRIVPTAAPHETHGLGKVSNTGQNHLTVILQIIRIVHHHRGGIQIN